VTYKTKIIDQDNICELTYKIKVISVTWYIRSI